MPIDLYPSIAKVKRNGVYQNLPGFVERSEENDAQAMIANAETSTTAQYAHPKDSYFRLNGVLYRATENIAVNDVISVGDNCVVSVVGNELYNLNGYTDILNENVCVIITNWLENKGYSSANVGAVQNLTPATVINIRSTIVDCKYGDIFTISGIGSIGNFLWSFVDSNNIVLTCSGARTYLDNVVIQAPENSSKIIIQQYLDKKADCFIGVSPIKIIRDNLAENKTRTLNVAYEKGQVTSAGLSNSTINVRSQYGIGFNQGEKLIVKCSSPDHWVSVYHVKNNSFYPITDNYLQGTSEIEADDWTYNYFIRVRRRVSSSSITPEEVKNVLTVQIVNKNPETVLCDDTYNKALSPFGFTRNYSYQNPNIEFLRKDLQSDGTLVDSTTRCLAIIPNCGCVEVKQEVNTGCFKIAKVTNGTVEYLVDDWSYYVYRYLGDNSSTYYLIVANSADQTTTITAENAKYYIGVYSYYDYARKVNKLYKLNGKKIAFIGDSITQGRFSNFGAGSPNYTTVKPFGELIAEEVNDNNFGQFGIGGALVSGSAWSSLYNNCSKVVGYDVVFVCGGTNDYGADVSAETFNAAYSYVVETLKSNNTEVVLCTPVVRKNGFSNNSAGLNLCDYTTLIKTIGSSNSLKVIDLFAMTNDNKFTNYLSDNLHPNEIGHGIIADDILNEYDRLSV